MFKKKRYVPKVQVRRLPPQYEIPLIAPIKWVSRLTRGLTTIEGDGLTDQERFDIFQQKLYHVHVFQSPELALQALRARNVMSEHGDKSRVQFDHSDLAAEGNFLLDMLIWPHYMRVKGSRVYDTPHDRLSCDEYLEHVGQVWGFDKLVIRKKDVSGLGRAESSYVLATVMEAIFGAVYLDAETRKRGSGLNAVAQLASMLRFKYGQ